MPQKSVTRDPSLSRLARRSMSASAGRTKGWAVTSWCAKASEGAGMAATSPGNTMTELPRLLTACCMAVCSTRGI